MSGPWRVARALNRQCERLQIRLKLSTEVFQYFLSMTFHHSIFVADVPIAERNSVRPQFISDRQYAVNVHVAPRCAPRGSRAHLILPSLTDSKLAVYLISPHAYDVSTKSTRNEGLPKTINPLFLLARPERFELPTTWFEAKYSIQLSYGRKF